MYYITTDNFDLLPDFHPEDFLSKDALNIPSNYKFEHCFLSDDLIANLLRTLNSKGYITEYSCSGHLYTGYIDFYNSDVTINSVTKDGFSAEVIPKLIQDINYETMYVSFDSSIKDIPDLKFGVFKYFNRENIYENKIVLRLKRNVVNRLRITDKEGFNVAFYKFYAMSLRYIERLDKSIREYWPDYDEFIKNKEE